MELSYRVGQVLSTVAAQPAPLPRRSPSHGQQHRPQGNRHCEDHAKGIQRRQISRPLPVAASSADGVCLRQQRAAAPHPRRRRARGPIHGCQLGTAPTPPATLPSGNPAVPPGHQPSIARPARHSQPLGSRHRGDGCPYARRAAQSTPRTAWSPARNLFRSMWLSSGPSPTPCNLAKGCPQCPSPARTQGHCSDHWT
jgi:hypothetical protein